MNKKSNAEKNIAFIYDDLVQVGGGEKFFLDLLNLYPNCEVYIPIISIKNKNLLKEYKFKYSRALSYFLNFGKVGYKLASVLSIFWFESLKLEKYDIVISLCNRFSGVVITPPLTKHVCIYTYPARILFEDRDFSMLKSLLRLYLFYTSKRADVNISISEFSKKRLKKYLSTDSLVLHPFTSYAASNFVVNSMNKDYFLIIGRCNKWKEKYFETAINIITKNNNKVLVIGKDFLKSPIYKKYKNNKNVIFKGYVVEKELKNYYINAIALVHPQIEDFGLTPLESLIYYTPVIAYKRGGVTEFLNKKVCLFYSNSKQLEDCLQKAPNFKIDIKARSSILANHSPKSYKQSLDLIIN